MYCLIVDEYPISLLGLRLLIKSNFPEWEIAAATTIHDAYERIDSSKNQQVDLVLLGFISNDKNSITFLSNLQHSSAIRPMLSIVISSSNDETIIAQYKKLGVRGCVPKNKDTSEIIRAVQSVCAGEEYFCHEDVTNTYAVLHNSINLTSRQRDLIDLLLAGHSNKTIAYILNLSYGTVKNYMFDLMRLMSVKSRLELVTKIRESAYQPQVDNSPNSMRCLRCKYALVNDPPK